MRLPGDDRRLIEDYLPLEVLNAIASGEKLHPRRYVEPVHYWRRGGRLRRCGRRRTRALAPRRATGRSVRRRLLCRAVGGVPAGPGERIKHLRRPPAVQPRMRAARAGRVCCSAPATCPTAEVVAGFFSFLGFPRLRSTGVVRAAIARGVETGLLGYATARPPANPPARSSRARAAPRCARRLLPVPSPFLARAGRANHGRRRSRALPAGSRRLLLRPPNLMYRRRR